MANDIKLRGGDCCVYVSTNVYLIALLTSMEPRIVGLGKVAYLNPQDDLCSMEVFWSPQNNFRVNEMIRNFGTEKVLLDLLKFEQQRRFLLRLIRQRKNERTICNTAGI